MGQLSGEEVRASFAGFKAEPRDTLHQEMKQLTLHSKDLESIAMSNVGSEDAGQVRGKHDFYHTQEC